MLGTWRRKATARAHLAATVMLSLCTTALFGPEWRILVTIPDAPSRSSGRGLLVSVESRYAPRFGYTWGGLWHELGDPAWSYDWSGSAEFLVPPGATGGRAFIVGVGDVKGCGRSPDPPPEVFLRVTAIREVATWSREAQSLPRTSVVDGTFKPITITLEATRRPAIEGEVISHESGFGAAWMDLERVGAGPTWRARIVVTADDSAKLTKPEPVEWLVRVSIHGACGPAEKTCVAPPGEGVRIVSIGG